MGTPQVGNFEPYSAATVLPAVGGPGATFAPQPPRKKKFLAVGAGVAAVLLLSSGAVFGFYLPNTPANVYSTGVNRTGKALNAVVTSATSQKQLEAYTTSTIKGSIDARFSGNEFSGDFTSTFDKASSDSGVNITLHEKDAAAKTLNLKALSQLAPGSTYPDIYLQISGLKALGIDAYAPGVSDYDGKWIVASSDYLKSLGSDFGVKDGDNTKAQPTATDVSELAKVASSVTQQYLFSTKADKAVLVKKSFVGKETVEDIHTYHYKVGVNLDHAKAYCVAMTNAIVSTDAYKKLDGATDSDIAATKKNASKNCDDSVKADLKSSDTFDVWIDSKYKLIHKIRVYDQGSKDAYTDIGQTYKGGSKVSLFVAFHDGVNKENGKVTFDADLKANTSSATFTMAGTNSDSPFNVTVKLSAAASSKPVTITKPTGAIPLQDVLKRFGADPAAVQTKSDDVIAKESLNSTQANLEAYYADNGYYPTSTQLISATWRKDNMSGLDVSTFKRSDGTTMTFGSSPSKTQLGYVPTTCDTNGCQDYTLLVLLSDGTTYSQNSLNSPVDGLTN